jgi:hypothetical protein
MAKKKLSSKRKVKLADAERHARFVDTARKIEASEDPKDFERAFKEVAGPRKSPSN